MRVWLLKVAVIGCGVMGPGIAQIIAQKGFQVNLMARRRSSLSKAYKMIWSRLRLNPPITLESPADVIERIVFMKSLDEAVSDVDFIIESIPEDLEEKKKLFKEIDGLAPKGAVITSNTSSLEITALAGATDRPDKVCGMHFFNPPQLMKLVEVIKGKETSFSTVETVSSLAQELGKEVVVVDNDYSIVNRVLFPALNAAIGLYCDGFKIEGIDKALRLGLNLKMGFIEIADYIGLDTVLSIMTVLEARTGVTYRCIPILEHMTEQGHLGRKTGSGFYVWKNGKRDKVR